LELALISAEESRGLKAKKLKEKEAQKEKEAKITSLLSQVDVAFELNGWELAKEKLDALLELVPEHPKAQIQLEIVRQKINETSERKVAEEAAKREAQEKKEREAVERAVKEKEEKEKAEREAAEKARLEKEKQERLKKEAEKPLQNILTQKEYLEKPAPSEMQHHARPTTTQREKVKITKRTLSLWGIGVVIALCLIAAGIWGASMLSGDPTLPPNTSTATDIAPLATDTATIEATLSPTPTKKTDTATPDIIVTYTPVPAKSLVISPENANQIMQLENIDIAYSVYDIQFSPLEADLAVLTSKKEQAVEIYDIDTLEQKHGFGKTECSIMGCGAVMAFSTNAETIAIASNGNVQLWNIADESLLPITFEGMNHVSYTSQLPREIDFSPDGTWLATSFGSRIYIWDINHNGRLYSTIPTGIFSIDIEFSPNGSLISSSGEGLFSWEIGGLTPEKLAEISISEFALSPSGDKVAIDTGSFSNIIIRMWNLDNPTDTKDLEGHTEYITDLVFSPDGNILASASADKTILLWDVNNGLLLATLEGHTEEITSVAFSPNGERIVSGSWDGTVRIWGIQP